VVAYSVSLKRLWVRAVAVVSRVTQDFEVLNSTSITMTAATIIALYRASVLDGIPIPGRQTVHRVERMPSSGQVEALHFHSNTAHGQQLCFARDITTSSDRFIPLNPHPPNPSHVGNLRGCSVRYTIEISTVIPEG
jgi:hypothetical protein